MAFNVNSSQYTFLNKFSRVSPNSTEWARIEYHLQLSLGMTSAVVKNIWSVASGHNTYNFEKNNKGLLVLDCWLESSALDENNRLDKVCQKGFDFPQSGMLFATGQIKLKENYGKNKIFEFLLLKIAVGKSYCLPAQSSKKEKYKLPYGFDSLYLYNDEIEEIEEFKHEYILFDNSQVLPSYLVHFELDAKKEESTSTPLCDICGETKATVYCKNDMCALCFDCDEEQHNKGGTLMKKHQRVPLEEKPKSFGNCAQHPDNKQELFCNICHIPLCVYCKINGSHSTGEPQNHQLAKITDAYNKAIAESRDLDPLLEKRKNTLSDLLLKIDVRIKDINRNASAIEEKIYQILQEALLKLQEETQKKMTFLIGDQLELKRQYEQVQWIESFLKYQQEILSPSDYLNNWSRHIILRNEILNLSNIPVVSNVMADLKLEGKINVISEEVSRKIEYEDNYPGGDKNTLEGDMGQSSSKFRSTIFNRHNLGDKSGSKIFKQSMNSKTGTSNISRDELGGSQAGFGGISLTSTQTTIPDMTKSLSTTSPVKAALKTTPYNDNSQQESPQKSAIKNSVVVGGVSNSIKGFQSATKQKTNIPQNSVPEDDNEVEDEFPVVKDFKKTTFSETKYPERMSGDNFLPTYSLQDDAKATRSATRLRPEEIQMNIEDKAFSRSNIITNEKDRELLYFNLPQLSLGVNFPEADLVAQYKRGDNLESVLRSVSNKKMGKMPPAVVIIQPNYGGPFGGYASECWDFQSKIHKSFGETSCFLFNIKNNQKFIPIENTPRSPNNQWLFQKNDSFGFGAKELIISIENEAFSTEIGSFYSGGVSFQKDDSTTALAGIKESSIEKLEIFLIR